MTTETTQNEGSTQTANTEQSGTQDATAALTAERDTLKASLEAATAEAAKVTNLQAALDALTAEKSKIAEEFDGLKSKIKGELVNSTLVKALEAAGAKASTTALKLIDATKIEFDEAGQIVGDTITAAIEAVKASDPFLFGTAGDAKDSQGGPTPPAVKVAATSMNTQTAFETELKTAKTQKDVERIVAKYNIK
jgi:hypothetical protein